LANDPNELNKLWNDPQSRHQRHELIERLARQMMALADSSPLAMHHGPRGDGAIAGLPQRFEPFELILFYEYIDNLDLLQRIF